MGPSENLRVVCQRSLERDGKVVVLFQGEREDCYAFMRGYRNPAKHFDLMYESGRLSSWVL